MFKQLAFIAKKKNLFPGLRAKIQKHVNLLEIRTANWKAKDPFAGDPSESNYESKYAYKLGIIKEFWHNHKYYIGACRDLKVSYKLLDITGPDWREVIKTSGCDAFLVYPSPHISVWKQMYDERLKILVKYDGITIFPSLEALWIWESKRRMHYWLDANNFLHPETWIFYSREEALSFAQSVPLPIVYKSDLGSGGTGVIIFRDRSKLRRHINCCFRKGFTTYRRGPNDKEWGFIIFQEYVENAREWRMIRIGDSFFGYEKLKIGDFHSGSHEWRYAKPPSYLLDLTRKITDHGGFLSMDIDIFVTPNGRCLINELQPLFGMGNPYEMCVVDGNPGRMVVNQEDGSWVFEKGNFCQNNLCNLRVETLLNILDSQNISS